MVKVIVPARRIRKRTPWRPLFPVVLLLVRSWRLWGSGGTWRTWCARGSGGAWCSWHWRHTRHASRRTISWHGKTALCAFLRARIVYVPAFGALYGKIDFCWPKTHDDLLSMYLTYRTLSTQLAQNHVPEGRVCIFFLVPTIRIYEVEAPFWSKSAIFVTPGTNFSDDPHCEQCSAPTSFSKLHSGHRGTRMGFGNSPRH